MATYYRISSIGDALPQRWSYCDAFEVVADESGWSIVDHTSPGAQVWSSAAAVVAALMGHHDGVYDAAGGYDRILIIEADETVDGGDWDAVTPQGVTSVRSLKVTGLIEALEPMLGEYEDEHDDDLGYWLAGLDDFDAANKIVENFLYSRSAGVEVQWVDTLGHVKAQLESVWGG